MRLLTTLGLFVLSFTMLAQDDITPAVSDALAKGNAAALTRYFVSSVDLTILDDEDMYPKDQVVQKLSQFFQRNKPSAFEVKHKGTSKLDDHYRIGDLTTATGVYRVTFFMRKGSAGMEIKQLRIERYE